MEVRTVKELERRLALIEKISTRPDPDGTNRKRSLLNLDSHDLMLEGIRETEDWDGLILRLYEMHNKRGRATIDLWREFGKARSTDLLEETVAGVKIQRSGRKVRFPYRNHQILSLKLEP